MQDVKLWLDSYDDIYSDFDSRQYHKRRISEDYLDELRNELKISEKFDGNIILLLPKSKRAEASEIIIAKGLSAYFIKQYEFHKNKCAVKLKNGILLFISGFFIMLFNTWFSFHFSQSFAVNFLRILLEPAGWFLLWAAFDFLYYDFTKLKAERNIYKQISSAQILFANAE